MKVSRTRSRSASVLCIVALFVTSAGLWSTEPRVSESVPDWSQWRGNARDGHAPGFGTVEQWPDRPREVWSVEVGEGQSSPLVVGQLVLLYDRVQDSERLSAFDLETGQQVWTRSDPVRFKAGMGGGHYGAGPKSTPVVQGGRVVTYGVRSLLTVRELETGKLAWRRDLHQEFEDPTLYWGNAMSPIVENDQVVVQFGNSKNGGVRAYDLASGEELWKIDGYGSSYSSPVAVDAAGGRQLVLMTWDGPLGVSLRGNVLWQVKEPMSFSRQNTATPVVARDLLVFSSEKRPLRAERLTQSGDGWRTEPVWARDELSLDMASPVAFDDRICGVTTRQKGQLVCLDLQTGRDIFRGPARSGEFAVLLVTPEQLLVVQPEGRLQVLDRRANEFEVLRELEIASSEVWAHPAVIEGGLIVKSYDRLTRLEFSSARE